MLDNSHNMAFGCTNLTTPMRFSNGKQLYVGAAIAY